MDRSYLKIGDGPNMVIGGSTDTAHKRWIEVVTTNSLRMSWNAPYQVAFTILTDSASPGLFRMSADSARRATAILDIPER
jgi:type VI protein secretion system component Hcp